ncbi:DUF6020 family protein [Jeotgalibacillus soli]|uniref:Glycosyltransferase RgtA/B/C/D-like domain-containing protein n=1 Tax=Jeotgalibacillus soli TaxID=889306 RepID=A0A0C2VZU1_9BACL|nr:DUF6020 family protein [Jeotgalibacillus soli]KIL49886.1 hypothetical protein KP78_13540 [Jeotgalibacillus soli]
MKTWAFRAAVSVVALAMTVGMLFYYFPIRDVPLLVLFLFIVAGIVVFQVFVSIVTQANRYTKREQAWTIAAVSILTVLWLISSKGPQFFLTDNAWYMQWFVYLSAYTWIWVTFISLIGLGYRLQDRKTATQTGKRSYWLYFSLFFFIGLLYFAAYFPAGMSPDSLASWDQAHTREFNNWHPIMFTWIIMGLIQIWDSPAIMSLFQITILAAILAYGFYKAGNLGVYRPLMWAMAFIIMVIPSYGSYTIIIWKDILFSAGLLLFTIQMYSIVQSKGLWLKNNLNVVMLFISSFIIIFIRHNGYPIFIIMMIILGITYRKQLWKPTLALFVFLVGINQIISGPVSSALNIGESDPNEALSIPTQQIANVIVSDGDLTEEQLDYFNEILPLEMWEEKYVPHTVDPIKFTWDYYNREVIFDDFPYYLSTWFAVVRQNPALTIEAFSDQTAIVWRMSTPRYAFQRTYNNTITQPNKYDLEIQSINQTYADKLSAYLDKSRFFPFKIVWRPAFYAFIILLSAILLFRKHRLAAAIIVLPFLLNLASVWVALPAQDFRYLFANVLIAFILPLLALVPKENEKKALGD